MEYHRFKIPQIDAIFRFWGFPIVNTVTDLPAFVIGAPFVFVESATFVSSNTFITLNMSNPQW